MQDTQNSLCICFVMLDCLLFAWSRNIGLFHLHGQEAEIPESGLHEDARLRACCDAVHRDKSRLPSACEQRTEDCWSLQRCSRCLSVCLSVMIDCISFARISVSASGTVLEVSPLEES